MQTICPVKSPHPPKNQTSLSNFKHFALLFFYIFKHRIFCIYYFIFKSIYLYLLWIKKNMLSHTITCRFLLFTTVPQTQRQSCLIAGWQPPVSEAPGERGLVA